MSRQLQELIASPGILGPAKVLVADTAFPVSGLCEGRIVTPYKEGEIERLPLASRLGARARSDAITSLRQAAEWGMGAACKVYRTLALPLPYNQEVRAVRLENIL